MSRPGFCDFLLASIGRVGCFLLKNSYLLAPDSFFVEMIEIDYNLRIVMVWYSSGTEMRVTKNSKQTTHKDIPLGLEIWKGYWTWMNMRGLGKGNLALICNNKYIYNTLYTWLLKVSIQKFQDLTTIPNSQQQSLLRPSPLSGFLWFKKKPSSGWGVWFLNQKSEVTWLKFAKFAPVSKNPKNPPIYSLPPIQEISNGDRTHSNGPIQTWVSPNNWQLTKTVVRWDSAVPWKNCWWNQPKPLPPRMRCPNAILQQLWPQIFWMFDQQVSHEINPHYFPLYILVGL